MKKFLDLVTRYPHAKLERANILKEYCDYRLSIPNKEKYKNGIHDYSLEKSLRLKISNLNSKYKGAKSSETIRLTVNN